VRIVQINYTYDPTTADPDALLDRYATLTGWSEALIGAGARAVTVAQRFSVDAECERAGVRYIFRRDEGPATADPRTRPDALHAAVVDERPDLVHVNGLMFPAQLEQLRRAVSKSAIVVQDHAGADPSAPRWWDVAGRLRRAARRPGLRAADAFLFTSLDQARPWRAARLIARRQPVFAIVESSTTLRPLAREHAREASGVAGHPAVLWVGRLDANKDPATVLDGFARAVDVLPDARLSMVYGSDDLLGQVRARVEQSPVLRPRVRLCGQVRHDRLAAFYSGADLFLLGSHHEGSGYAVIEAMACGCVPVVTDIPSFRAITRNGAVGMLWTPGDAWALASALARCARLDAAAARLDVRAHFDATLSWPTLGRRALCLYTSIVRRFTAGGRPLTVENGP
jgi:glycosyltransferase involved in cell wall biosynthesis